MGCSACFWGVRLFRNDGFLLLKGEVCILSYKSVNFLLNNHVERKIVLNKDKFHMSCQKQDICGIVHEREITTTKTIIDLRTNPYGVYKHKCDRVSRSEDDCSLYLSGGDLIVFLCSIFMLSENRERLDIQSGEVEGSRE